MRSLSCRLIAATTCVFLGSGIDPARAAEEGALVVIVDGSGSMWGQIEGTRQTKLAVTREALRHGLGKFSPQARVGLALFGHRRGDAPLPWPCARPPRRSRRKHGRARCCSSMTMRTIASPTCVLPPPSCATRRSLRTWSGWR
jgi:hypothetical protein